MKQQFIPAWLTWRIVWCALAASAADKPPVDRSELIDVVTRVFREVHDGWSTDEVLVRDDLNAAFVEHCRAALPGVNATEFNWTLISLRKARKLDVPTTKRESLRHDDYVHAAEIAARSMYDKYQLTIDRVLCDPVRRHEFDQLAKVVAPDVSADRLRKAGLKLRKTRKLKPELVTRVADWGREVIALRAKEIVDHPSLVPAHPGVYIFRDATGYLYIGEAANLRTRVNKHLDQSDRQSLAQYLWREGCEGITVELHVFDPDSKARLLTVRRAYESELIRSRQPRLNIAP